MKQYKLRSLYLVIALLLVANASMAQGPGSVETTGGTPGASALSMAAGDTTSSLAESLYIGPGDYQINGTWNIYSRNIWISPDATITGTGILKCFNPSVAGGASSPTWIDGNNNAAFVGVDMELDNAASMILTDLPGPGGSWTDAVGQANLTVGKGFIFAVAGGHAVLGNYDMVTATGATLNNYQPDRFVVTNGTGHLVHNNYTGAFTYPVGIAPGDYTPASVNNTIANTIHVLVQNYATSAATEFAPDGIDRTWNIYADNATANSLLDLQHNMATNNTGYNDAASFVTQYSATTPNTTGQTNLSQNNWQSNNTAPGTGSGTLTTGAAIVTASERSLSYTTLATAATAPEAYYTKSSNQVMPLPLRLTGFSGRAVDCSARLSWTTAGESGMHYFDLQKSTDGRSFEQLARIAAKGDNSRYAYTDEAAIAGNRYYRLRIVSGDGMEAYSNTVFLNVDCARPQEMTVSPNPVNNKVTVSGVNAGHELYITDVSGRVMTTVMTGNAPQQIDLTAYARGVYLLHVVHNGLPVKTVRLVKL